MCEDYKFDERDHVMTKEEYLEWVKNRNVSRDEITVMVSDKVDIKDMIKAVKGSKISGPHRNMVKTVVTISHIQAKLDW